jgi:uroporphyrinogen decarboxylase
MTRKERFLAAVHRQQPDRVPLFDFLFQQPMYQALIGRCPQAYNARDAVALSLVLDLDAVWVPFGDHAGFQPRYLDANTYVDEWGTTFRKNDSAWPIDAPIAYPITSRSDLARYKAPDPTLPDRASQIETAFQVENDSLAITSGVDGPFTRAWFLMGYEQMCYTLYDDPALLTALFRMATDYGKEAARLAVRSGCHAIWIGDDLGDSHSGFVNPTHFRRYYLPYLAELAEYIDSLGVPVLLHCCGHFSEYLQDIAQTRIAAIHPLQRTAGMDLRAIKEQYGQRFCIIGNIDSSRTLPFGTPTDVAAEVREAIDIAAPGGGYVLSSDHSLHDGIPVANILEMFRVAGEYGRAAYSRDG